MVTSTVYTYFLMVVKTTIINMATPINQLLMMRMRGSIL